jgi:glycosyltransferase involved in cell wall biosynthesis
MNTAPVDGERRQLPVVFVIWQTGRRADGGVRSISLVIEQLTSVRPVIVTNAETGQTAAWRARGYEVHVWDVPDPPAAWGGGWRAAIRRSVRASRVLAVNARIRSLVRTWNATVVHCNDQRSLWMAALGAKAAGARVVFNLRGTLGVRGLRWQMSRVVSDRLLVLSAEMKDYAERALPRPTAVPPSTYAPVEAIYSLVDLDRMAPATPEQRAAIRQRLAIPESTFAVGVIAAFVGHKQQLELIEYLAARPTALPEGSCLYFVGDFSPEKDAYCRQCLRAAQHPGLTGRLKFVDFSAAVDDWYRSLDLVVVSSRVEGLARCMIESIACGTPVVSFDVCSAREILEQQGCGVVVPQGRFDELMAAVQALAADEVRRTALGKAGPVLARRLFAPAAVGAAYDTLYRTLGGKAGTGAEAQRPGPGLMSARGG